MAGKAETVEIDVPGGGKLTFPANVAPDGEELAALVERMKAAEGGVVPGEWLPDTRTVFQRIVAIVGELPAIGKDSQNTQQKFMYRAHDDVLAALNPLLAKHGLFVVPRVAQRETTVRETSGGKAMYEVSLLVEFGFIGLAGDSVIASAWGEGTDMGDKATSKAHTMAFKSALAIVFAISTHELSDADAGTPEDTVVRGGATGQAARGHRTAPAPQKPFDPGKDTHPAAVAGQALSDLLTQIGPSVDWPATLGPIVLARFGVGRGHLTDEQKPEYLRRLSNAAAKIAEQEDVTAFPPVESTNPAAIKAALAWAFALEPTQVEIVEKPVNPESTNGGEDTPADDVPWVDDVKEALEAKEAADRDPDPPETEGAADGKSD